MKKFLATLAMLALPIAAAAQGPPNDPSFVKLTTNGPLYGESNGGNYQTTQEVLLPEGFKLDRSYHQASVNCCGGGATSYMKASEIPAGIHISVSGGHYWAVPSAPAPVPVPPCRMKVSLPPPPWIC